MRGWLTCLWDLRDKSLGRAGWKLLGKGCPYRSHVEFLFRQGNLCSAPKPRLRNSQIMKDNALYIKSASCRYSLHLHHSLTAVSTISVSLTGHCIQMQLRHKTEHSWSCSTERKAHEQRKCSESWAEALKIATKALLTERLHIRTAFPVGTHSKLQLSPP